MILKLSRSCSPENCATLLRQILIPDRELLGQDEVGDGRRRPRRRRKRFILVADQPAAVAVLVRSGDHSLGS